MDTAVTRDGLRESVREICARFPDEYWRELDARREYPEEFVRAMTEAGHLGALIPEEYGGMGLGLADTSVILEEINRSGGNAQPAHAQVYTMGTLLRHGSEEQKGSTCPGSRAASSGCRPSGHRAGGRDRHDLARTTTAVRDGDHYVVNGRKIYISRVQHSDCMILLAGRRRARRSERKSEGLSVFLFDLDEAVGNGLTVNPRRVMMNNETNELVFEDLAIPAHALIGEEGPGLPLRARRDERRAGAHRRRVHRQRPLVR